MILIDLEGQDCEKLGNVNPEIKRKNPIRKKTFFSISVPSQYLRLKTTNMFSPIV
jgi:hypothetical protein